MTPVDRAAGALYGLALGDALGAPTEFCSFEQIVRRWGADGPPEPVGTPARVTDDTQMALAVGDALLEHDASGRPFSAADLEEPLRRAFVAWAISPENDRAPGMTCLQACDGLRRGLPWLEATVHGSKGCGANMRVPPVGLLALRGVDAPTRAAVAQFQAALTHGHPTALAASDLTAQAVADLALGGDAAGLPGRLCTYATQQRHVYQRDWLGDLWQRPGVDAPKDFIARGWDECLAALERVEQGLASYLPGMDPCRLAGTGWTAEEALATGLLCFLLSPDDAVAAIRRAATTSGDSDSIACLAGAFAGAHLGREAWSAAWRIRIEYRDRLERLSVFLGRDEQALHA